MDSITPVVNEISTENNNGVQIDYKEALELTSFRLFECIGPDVFANINEVNLKIHDGLDASGSHSIFNQKGSADTNNIIMYMFRAQIITSADKVLWENQYPGSTDSCQPLALFMGKETFDNCSFVSQIQRERANLTFSLDIFGRTIHTNFWEKFKSLR